MDRTKIRENILSRGARYQEMAAQIWDYAEIAFHEHRSAQLLCAELEREGFSVERGLAGIPTAFAGRWGSGSPVIGLLGEFDALSGMDQMSGVPERRPTAPEKAGGNGHGCGHNCLGVGALAAAVAVKEYLSANRLPGTVVYFGCPAEEGGSGKTFMARAGAFAKLDAALTWHPYDVNQVFTTGTLANCQARFSFRGISSHAGMAPHLGRSALDALELMNTGIQYLREHIIESARIHYAILDAGGTSPNVVQSTASGLYLIRAPEIQDVRDIYRRVQLVARGAAMMTETEVDMELIKACSNLLPNETLEQLLYRNMTSFPLPEYTPEERDFAQEIIATYPMPHTALTELLGEYPKNFHEELRELFRREKEINRFVLPFYLSPQITPGSTDVGDISHNCPTAQFFAASLPDGCLNHSWQEVACTRTSIAFKGMLYAGMVLAGATVELLERPELVEAAQQEFREKTGGCPYQCPIPDEIQPPISKSQTPKRRI